MQAFIPVHQNINQHLANGNPTWESIMAEKHRLENDPAYAAAVAKKNEPIMKLNAELERVFQESMLVHPYKPMETIEEQHKTFLLQQAYRTRWREQNKELLNSAGIITMQKEETDFPDEDEQKAPNPPRVHKASTAEDMQQLRRAFRAEENEFHETKTMDFGDDGGFD